MSGARVGVGLVVVLMAAVAACGDAGALSSEEVADEMNRICLDNGRAFDEIGHPENFEEIAEMTPQLIEVFDGTLALLDELNVGPDEAAAVAEFVTLGEQQSELMGRLHAAAVSGDGAAFEVVVEEMGPVAERSNEVANNLGATECVGS